MVIFKLIQLVNMDKNFVNIIQIDLKSTVKLLSYNALQHNGSETYFHYNKD